MKKALLFVAISAVLGALRIAGVKHEAFQAVAHVWCGYLCCGWFERGDRLYAALVIGLSIIETIVATIDHWSQITALLAKLFG